MPELKITIEISVNYTKPDKSDKTIILRTKAINTKMDLDKQVVHESTQTFNHAPGIELEHYLASAADILESSLKLHGDEFGA